MNNIQHNYQALMQRIHQLAQQANRNPQDIQLIAVSKTFPSHCIRKIHGLGQRHFGENYVQEWAEKTEQLSDLSTIIWHIIGNIQSNKTRIVAERAQWVHTINRLKIAQRLNEQRPKSLPPLNICIEINISQEPNKHGISPDELLPLAHAILPLERLKLRGLMCVASQDPAKAQEQFHHMQGLLTQLQTLQPDADTLSMGMSNDLASAIANGTTLLRIGSAIFGKR